MQKNLEEYLGVRVDLQPRDKASLHQRQLIFELETKDDQLLSDMLHGVEGEIGEKTFTEGASVRFAQVDCFYAIAPELLPEVLQLAITFTTAVSAKVVANWLYDKIKSRKTTLRTRTIRVKIDRDEILRVLLEESEQSE